MSDSPALIDGPAPLSSGRLRRTPLFETHRRLGAKLVAFGGWEMPLSYPAGTLAEHRACRHDAAVFDVSHLGTVRISGPDAYSRIQGTLTNDLTRIGPGRAQYTHLLAEDASVVDDLIVWWLDNESFDLMPNASNTDRVIGALGGRDVTDQRAVLAIQGPGARARIGRLVPVAAAVPRFGVTTFEWEGSPCVAAGTGYTGEDGIECAVPSEVAESFWNAVMATGVSPAGLGARDTLRLEAALPLHGHELGPGITPCQARLGWVVGWDKPTFAGRAALEAERAAGPRRLLTALATRGRRPPRDGGTVRSRGLAVGSVTSGNYSPMLGHGIALALVAADAGLAGGDSVEIVLRGGILDGTVVPAPFVRAGQWAIPTAAGPPFPTQD